MTRSALSGRQHRDCLDLEQEGRVSEARHLQQRGGGQRLLVGKVGAADFAEFGAVRLEVGQVAGELDDVLEAAADRGGAVLMFSITCTVRFSKVPIRPTCRWSTRYNILN